MKITLTGPALRAFTKDQGDEFTLEIRKGVLKEAVRHSKLLVGRYFDSAMERAQAQFETSLNKLAIKKLGKFTGHWNSRTFKFNKAAEAAVDQAVRDHLREQTSLKLTSKDQQEYINDRIKWQYDDLKRRIDVSIGKYISKEVDARIVSEVQRRLDKAAKGA